MKGLCSDFVRRRTHCRLKAVTRATKARSGWLETRALLDSDRWDYLSEIAAEVGNLPSQLTCHEACFRGLAGLICAPQSSTVSAQRSWSRHLPAIFRYRGENPSNLNPSRWTNRRDRSLSG
jgi:hypothetical protein